MIDWSRVEELRAEVGEEDFAEVVELFLVEVEEVLQRMRAAPAPTGLAEDLHFLKGSALNLGFEALADLCSAGERMAGAGRPADVQIGGILDCYENSRQLFLEAAPRKVA